ncbi:MAG: putative lipid II flippase FtsW [Streptosporangiales bacterium]|nr:putative lipid II flippase FtsW [Streptosporangiales bacterium]
MRSRLAVFRKLFDRPHASYYLLVGCTALLTALGLLMVLSASSVHAYASGQSAYYYFQRQAIWVGVGLVALAVSTRMPARVWRMLAYPILVLSVVLLAATLVPGMGHEVNGAQRWLDFGGPFRVQPSEFAKLGLVLWGADLLARKEKLGTLREWRHLLVPLIPGAGLVVLLVMLGEDLGTTLVLLTILLALLWVIGAPLRLFASMLLAVGGLVVLLILIEPYRVARLTSFADPFADAGGTGYQAVQGMYAIATGGLFGVGLGASREKWGYLPHGYTDFIFAIIGEELGLIGTLVVLALFALLAYAGLRVARRVTDPFMRLAAGAVTAWLVVQAVVNVGAVIGVLPITGIPLPLVSYGGSALLPTMVALGMLLSFVRQEPGAARALAGRGPGPLTRVVGWFGYGPAAKK